MAKSYYYCRSTAAVSVIKKEMRYGTSYRNFEAAGER